VSVHVWKTDLATGGQSRIDQLAAYRDLGISRVMGLLDASAETDEALEGLVEDSRAAGVAFD
jgi:hypothetical protein